jgi:uncharacterized Fe-S radical SAM superfamily protein PflX
MAIVSSAFPHRGEEDCLRGRNGSGTIFFAMCNLRCVFCQNWDISQKKSGREMTASQIADLMLALQDRGCHNINFVTPEHVAPQVGGVEAQVAGRRVQVAVAEEDLDRAQVHAGLEQRRGEGAPQRVRREVLR